MASRVHAIFEEVKKTRGSSAHPSQLFIIQSNNEPWAVALEDKNIILTSGAIDIIYSAEDSLSDKDARMAFVLGHELKHVIDNDFSHAQAYEYFSKPTVSELISRDDNYSKTRKALELLADEEGLISASLAGYDTSAIFSNAGNSDNFLEYWADQTETNNGGDQHHTPQERIEYLKQIYGSIHEAVEFYKYGVRLAHFGDYSNARVLLEDFYKVYESSQVLSNRGFVHLQMARSAMDEGIAYRFWFPDFQDLDSGFRVSPSRNYNLDIPDEARKHLNEAITLLTAGLTFSEDDLSTRMNLITAYLFLEEYSAARAVIEGIDGWEEHSQLLGLDALIVMNDSRLKNPWNTFSLEKLERVVSRSDSPHNLTYNFARLLQLNNQADRAQDLWKRLAENVGSLPINYQIMVCRELIEREQCVKDLEKPAGKLRPWKLRNIRPGDSIQSNKVRQFLKKWNSSPIQSFTALNAKIYPDIDGASLLALNDEVKLIAIWKHGIDSVDSLVNQYGPPNQILHTGVDQLYSYGPQWSALVSDNRVREIWIAQ